MITYSEYNETLIKLFKLWSASLDKVKINEKYTSELHISKSLSLSKSNNFILSSIEGNTEKNQCIKKLGMWKNRK